MNLTIAVDLPAEVEQRLHREMTDLAEFAREAVAVQLFRDGKLAHYGLGQTLGLDRFETDALLKRYRVEEGALSHADVNAEVESLNRSPNGVVDSSIFKSHSTS